MKICGIQKLSLQDFPEKLSAIVFTGGCNLRCPFCHNATLALGSEQEEIMSEDELLSCLEKRRGRLEGVCISGGEPTLQNDLVELIRAIKDLGYLVKLDTNGTRPDVVKALAEENLIDYVAMDIKNSPARYPGTAGAPHMDLCKVEQTMTLLMGGLVDYEFRTTVVNELHDGAAMQEMGQWLQKLSGGQKVKRLYLQCYMDRDTVLMGGLSAPSKEKMQEFRAIIAPFAETVELRGID